MFKIQAGCIEAAGSGEVSSSPKNRADTPYVCVSPESDQKTYSFYNSVFRI